MQLSLCLLLLWRVEGGREDSSTSFPYLISSVIQTVRP